MKIIDLLANNAAGHPERLAVKNGDIEVTYSRLLSCVRSLSEILASAGCRSGVKVAVVLNNSIEYLISFFAISAANGIILPLSARMTPYEIAAYIDKADASIVIAGQSYLNRLSNAQAYLDKVTTVCIQYYGNNNLKLETNIRRNNKPDDEENKDVALMVPTSGTTGLSKIVMLTDNQLISNMIAYRSLMNFDTPNVVCCSLAMHHIYCICAQMLTHTSLADTFIINDRPFFIKDFLKTVETSYVTISAFVPFMAVLLAEFPEPHKFSLETLKCITLSGAKTPTSAYKLLTAKYPTVKFINMYGMTEAGSRISAAAPCPQQFPVESVGRPIPTVNVRIVNDNGNVLPANRIGEVQVKSTGVMKGYYKQHALTAQTIIDGWLKTGDLGKLDENGSLFLLGRNKDIINSGGENLYPSEIEDCLLEHPAIREAAVVAKEDRLLQEVPCAFVVKKTLSENVTVNDIKLFCKNRLSSRKIPAYIKFIDKLPRLTTSKIDRNLLIKMTDNL